MIGVALSKVTGLEVAEQLRADESTADTKIVLVLTNLDDLLHGHTPTRLADKCISKPFTPNEPVTSVRDVLDSVRVV